MKNVLIVLLLVFLALMGWMWHQESQATKSLGTRMSHLEDSLSYTHNALRRSNQSFDVLKREKDSLFTLASNAAQPKAIKAPTYSANEKAIHRLVYNLHNSWEDLFLHKDTDKFLTLFMPEFTTNEVTIDTENIPHVERHNNTDFVEHILSTFVKDNIFTITYQTHLEVKNQYQTVQQSKIICYVSGEKVNGTWKVGNYNWTRYDFMENKYQAVR